MNIYYLWSHAQLLLMPTIKSDPFNCRHYEFIITVQKSTHKFKAKQQLIFIITPPRYSLTLFSRLEPSAPGHTK